MTPQKTISKPVYYIKRLKLELEETIYYIKATTKLKKELKKYEHNPYMQETIAKNAYHDLDLNEAIFILKKEALLALVK